VIDVGSNSGRLVLLSLGPGGHLQVLAGGRAPLRLALDTRRGRLTEETIARTAAVLADFAARASAAGARRTMAVATAAVRESENGAELIERIRSETGVRVEVIDGDQEARYSFLGAIHGLPVDHGLVLDVGGGSLEVTRFRDRRETRSSTLPLGALRMSDRFLASDPPDPKEVESLRRHVAGALEEADIGELAGDERLVGTGGTIRNLAKMDQRSRPYPIPRIHGYVLARRRLEDQTAMLTSRRMARRRALSGLSRDRADSIPGGAVTTLALVEAVGAADIVVSGQGLREGLVLDSIAPELPPVEAVRRASVLALAARFSTWDAGRAERRTAIAATLVEAVDGGLGAPGRERLNQAATLLDVGRSIDYYRRYEHTSEVIVQGDLAGFTHRKLALLAAVVRQAGDPSMRIQTYRPLLGAEDRDPVARAATILALADEIEQRLPPGVEQAPGCHVQGKTVTLDVPVLDPWRRDTLAVRFRKVFGMRLAFDDGQG
jgi:exopolyphosphatase / guanosine-5'-triphosphate,3'-diphosphate pyrophosphatase